MKLTELFEATIPKSFTGKPLSYSIEKSMPSVTVYHGTTEKDAENGLKNDDHFNTEWAKGSLPKNSFHFTTSLDLAKAYALSGLSRTHIAKYEKDLEAQIDKDLEDENKLAIEMGLDPNPNLLSVALKFRPEDLDKKYPQFKKLGEKEYRRLLSLWQKEVSKRAKERREYSKSEEAKLAKLRGDGGYVLSFTLSPKRVLVFETPFDKTDPYALFDVFKQAKGKFDCVFFPNSLLRPENYKGPRIARSDYYIVVGNKLLSDKKRISV